jgi:3-methyladenine DNA glycosylase AlkD
MLLDICAVTVQDPERFAQTGTGWVLRELSIAEPVRVADFVDRHLQSFSTEALKQAIAKLPQPEQARLRRRHKEILSRRR